MTSFKIKNKKIFLLELCLLLLSALACAKCLILGLRSDEEYAVSMAYRMTAGDRMFLDMWEPHQTSGFLCAALIRIFSWFSSSLDYLLLYLRFAGILLQGAVSIFTYTTLKKRYPQPLAFFCGLFCFTLLPKWILVPEFSNLLLWGNLCTMMCFLRIYYDARGKYGLLILAGLSTCCAVLAYPTSLLTAAVYAAAIFKLYPQKARKYAGCYLGTCFLSGVLYLFYFLLHMSPGQLMQGISQMSVDGSHSHSFTEKLLSYGQELVMDMLPWLLYLLPLMLIAYLFLFLWKQRHRAITCALFLVLISMAQQLLIWLGPSTYLNQPYLFFYIAFLAGGLVLKRNPALTWIGIWPACSALVAALLLTNTGIRVTGAYLLPGILAVLLAFYEALPTEKSESPLLRPLYWFTLFAFSGLLLFVKGYLVNENEGYKEDVFYVKQKALSGPAKNIYCRYTDGYQYNIVAELASQYVSEEDAVLCVSEHSLWYLLTEGTISAYSTISTPTFDERLLEYWELHPEKYPDIVLAAKEYPDLDRIIDLLNLESPLAEQEGILIYRVNPR